MAEYKQVGEYNIFIKRTDKKDSIRCTRQGLEMTMLFFTIIFLPVSGILYSFIYILWEALSNLMDNFIVHFIAILILMPLIYLAARVWLIIVKSIIYYLVDEITIVELTKSDLSIKRLGITTKVIKLESIEKLVSDEDPILETIICVLKDQSEVRLNIIKKNELDLEFLETLIINPSIHTSLINRSILSEVIVVKEKSYPRLVLTTTDYKLSEEDDMRFLVAFVLTIVYFFFNSWYIKTALIVFIIGALYGRIYKLYKRLQMPKVIVSRTSISKGLIRYFLKTDYQIKKEDIALFSTTTTGTNQYAIQVVSQTGDIHQLPIPFESEEKAQEQIDSMKQLLKLE